MRFRAWHDNIKCFDGKAVEAETDQDAAYGYIESLDVVGDAFPDDNNGDKCTIRICAWEELDEDADEPESRLFVFKLVKERRVELK